MRKYKLIAIDDKDYSCHDSIRIAVASVRVYQSYTSANLDGQQNLSINRRRLINEVLNSARKEKCNLVAFPEVYIPFSWVKDIAQWCKQEGIAVIGGIEHRIFGGVAYNQIVTILPFKTKNGLVKDAFVSFRTKRHYAPSEIAEIQGRFLKLPQSQQLYELFYWRGCYFASYNCFELTELGDRSLFKSKADFLVASVFNRDTPYFGNIVESASRDLHAYIIQVNDSYYGDSRIVAPKRSEEMDIVRVKGGENTTILTATLDLKSLREHQSLDYPLQERHPSGFKKTPPMMDQTWIHRRRTKPSP